MRLSTTTACFQLFGCASSRGPSGSSPIGRGRGSRCGSVPPAYGGVRPSKFRAGGAGWPHSLWKRRGGGKISSNQSITDNRAINRSEGKNGSKGPPLRRGPPASRPRRERPRASGMLCPPTLILSSEPDFSMRKCGAGQHVTGRHVIVDVPVKSGGG